MVVFVSFNTSDEYLCFYSPVPDFWLVPTFYNPNSPASFIGCPNVLTVLIYGAQSTLNPGENVHEQLDPDPRGPLPHPTHSPPWCCAGVVLGLAIGRGSSALRELGGSRGRRRRMRPHGKKRPWRLHPTGGCGGERRTRQVSKPPETHKPCA